MRLEAPQSALTTWRTLPGSRADLHCERVVFWTIALVPLWWILGLQVAVYPLVGWYLFWRSLRRPEAIGFPLGFNLWWTYIAVWLLSLFVNLASGSAPVGRSLTTLGSILGVWMLLPIVWYAMRRAQVRYRVVVRALAVLGLCQLIAVGIGEAYLRATGKALEINSVLVTLVPSLPARLFFEATFYGFDRLEWGADPVPRLKSFYYWPPLAGTMSIFVCMAALTESNRFWRWLALAGGVSTAYFAAARSGQVGIALGVLIAVWLMGGTGRRLLNWGLAAGVALLPVVAPRLYDYFFVYRSDSGAARLALYDETLQAFYRSPLLGYGTHGHSEVLEVPLGSHSQVYSTLYHTGVVGAAVLVCAWLAMAWALLRLGLGRPELAPGLGAWVGLTVAMLSGELEAASVTVFVLAAWLGVLWNRFEEPHLPWQHLADLAEQPAPWQPERPVRPAPHDAGRAVPHLRE